jgi:hypothetical protein
MAGRCHENNSRSIMLRRKDLMHYGYQKNIHMQRHMPETIPSRSNIQQLSGDNDLLVLLIPL